MMLVLVAMWVRMAVRRPVRRLVRMFAKAAGFMGVPTRALAGMNRLVRRCIRMHMVGSVSMRVPVIRVALVRLALMRMIRRNAFARQHIHFGSSNAAAAHFPHLEMRAYVQRRSRLGQCVERNSGIDKGAQQHVAADPGETLQISNAHRFLILSAWVKCRRLDLGAAAHEHFCWKNNVH